MKLPETALVLRPKIGIQWNDTESIKHRDLNQNMHGAWEQCFAKGMMYECQPQKGNIKEVMGAEA